VVAARLVAAAVCAMVGCSASVGAVGGGHGRGVLYCCGLLALGRFGSAELSSRLDGIYIHKINVPSAGSLYNTLL
jgi:hypothetical protein